MQVRNIPPGSLVVTPMGTAVFLHSVRHPLWKNLKLVVWWIHDEGRWSFDALSPEQEIEGVYPQTPEDRQKNLQRILTNQD